MRSRHGTYSPNRLSAMRRAAHMMRMKRCKDKTMTYAPHPISADDPLAYFAALTLPKPIPVPVVPAGRADRALALMYGYYSVE